MERLFCPYGHQVYTEQNAIGDGYPFFCPACDENFYGFECELKEVDTKFAHKVVSSNGEIDINAKGDVLVQSTSPECSKVVWFDLDEYENFWGKKPDFEIDILDLRGILADGRELIWESYRRGILNS